METSRQSLRKPVSSRRDAMLGMGIAAFGVGLACARADGGAAGAVPVAECLNVRSFGAKGDGKADDTSAFQKALDAAHATGGGTVFVPPGQFLIGSHLVIPKNVTLRGIFNGPPTAPWKPESVPNALAGSVLLAVEGEGRPDSTPFIQLDYNSTLQGMVIFHPRQKDADPPIAYPWTVSSRLSGADNCSVVDVLLVNPYQAVDFGGRHTGRHYVRNLYGQPLYRGLYIDHCLDVGRVENVHFWPFWRANGGAAESMRKNGKAFIIGRTDWQWITGCFCINYETGFQFIKCAGSNPAYHGRGNAQIVGGGADACNRAVHVVELQGHSGIRFTNSQFYGDIVVENTNHGPVQFSGCGFFGSIDGSNGVALAHISGGGKVSFTDCHIHCIDARNKAKPLILAKTGRLQVRGCEFLDGHAPRDHVVLEAGVFYANVSDNTSRAPFIVANKAKGKTVVRDNLSET